MNCRMCGCMAPIIADEKSIQHNVLKSLESRDEVEIEAAIYAADRLCARSKTFASAIGKTISAMIERMS